MSPRDLTPGELPPEDDSGDAVPAVVATIAGSSGLAGRRVGIAAVQKSADLLAVHPERTAHHRARRSCRPARFHGLDVEMVGVVVWSVWVVCCRVVVWSVSVICCRVVVWSVSVICCLVVVWSVSVICCLVVVWSVSVICCLVVVWSVSVICCLVVVWSVSVICCLVVVSSETSALVISAGAAGMLSSGGKPMMARALLMPSPIALTQIAGHRHQVERRDQPRRGGLPRRDAAVIAQVHDHLEERLDHIDQRLGHPQGAQRTEQRQVLASRRSSSWCHRGCPGRRETSSDRQAG